ncbi:MAG: molybdate ABC transporter permease subunit [Phycisphaerales bacterium]|nr:MAG: molybdate ABC transporter permease subunit [Phycisphaerales bacterium]
MLTDAEYNAVLLSIQVALASVALMLPPGIAVAWLLARRRFVGKAVVDALVHLPLVLPPVVVGYLLLELFGRNGPLGGPLSRAGISVAFTWRAAAIASAVVGFPLLVRAVRLSIELVDGRLEEAARTLGATRLWTFLTVTLPLCLPGVLSGMVLAFARSLGEFGATMTFAGNVPGRTQTLPLAVYTYIQTPHAEASVHRLALVSVLLSFAALMMSDVLARRLRRRWGHA